MDGLRARRLRLLVVDCGVLFLETEQPGIDLDPSGDFSYLRDRWDDLDAIVLTHGHEDHIGAVPYLGFREKPDVPADRLPAHARRSLEGKLREHPDTAADGMSRFARARRSGWGRSSASSSRSTTRSRTRWGVGHPRTAAFRHGAATPVTFKMDQLPLGRTDHRPSAGGLGSAPRASTLLMSDSTNAEVPGFVTSEREIGPVLPTTSSRGATRRIIVACFASHVHRVQQVLDFRCQKHHRRVAFIGRSMVRNMGIARAISVTSRSHPGWSRTSRRSRTCRPSRCC